MIFCTYQNVQKYLFLICCSAIFLYLRPVGKKCNLQLVIINTLLLLIIIHYFDIAAIIKHGLGKTTISF